MALENVRIYYADDDPDDIFLFEMAMKELKLSNITQTFSNVDDLISGIHTQSPTKNLVFIDLNMPVKTGHDFLAAIKNTEAAQCTEVHVLSTSSADFDKKRAFEGGATSYIEKAFDYNELKQRLAQVINPLA